MAVRLIVSGCCGRMGQCVGTLALKDGAFAIGGALEAAGHDAIGRDYGTVLGQPAPLGVSVVPDARTAMREGDVVIEFSAPRATVTHVEIAQQLKKPMVIGTTGLSEGERATIASAAKGIPIVMSPNMSLGVNVLFELAQVAAQRLGPAYRAEVVERHHRQKKDAPSGTAKRLAELIAASHQEPVSAVPVESIREGDIVGDHTVVLVGPSERLELTHRAQSREVFAQGALAAAAFVHAQSPGLYDMSHVLRALAGSPAS